MEEANSDGIPGRAKKRRSNYSRKRASERDENMDPFFEKGAGRSEAGLSPRYFTVFEPSGIPLKRRYFPFNKI